jgi:translocator assembly and maintenance protein 41
MATTTTTTTTTDSGQLTSSQKLTDLVDTIFSSNQIIHAFGYGSGVFSQGQNHQPGMLDIILVVQDAQVFHWENQAKNPSHYATWLRLVDPQGYVAAGLQRCFLGGIDGKVLFHVIEDPIPLKYGVIQYEDFIQDLTQWTSLYVAGRLHKPTLTIPLSTTTSTLARMEFQEPMQQAQHTNLQAAVAAAMLLSPLHSPTISWLEFYSKIASLSYTGDFRMQVGGEDPHKIAKLVQTPGQLERFHALYRGGDESSSSSSSSISRHDDKDAFTHHGILQSFEQMGLLSIGTNGLEWDPSNMNGRNQFLQKLPPAVQKPLLPTSSLSSRFCSTSQTNPPGNYDASALASQQQQQQQQQQQSLTKILESIVAPAARYQSFKGLFTFGLRKSIKYASAKLSKGLLRKR